MSDNVESLSQVLKMFNSQLNCKEKTSQLKSTEKSKIIVIDEWFYWNINQNNDDKYSERSIHPFDPEMNWFEHCLVPDKFM